MEKEVMEDVTEEFEKVDGGESEMLKQVQHDIR
jgi:hypothetical protein